MELIIWSGRKNIARKNIANELFKRKHISFKCAAMDVEKEFSKEK